MTEHELRIIVRMIDNQVKVVGKLIEPYNPRTTDWITYETLLKNMLQLNNVVQDQQKKMYIMSMIGMTAFAELQHAWEGKDINNVTAENLFEMLREICAQEVGDSPERL